MLVTNNDIIISGQYSEWTSYFPCDKSCGGGQKIRTRTCNTYCPNGSTVERVPCNTQPCIGNINITIIKL